MLSRNEIGDQGAFELGRAIEARVAFPNLRLVSMGGNALSVCRGGLEPQTSTPQEVCTHTRMSLALNRPRERRHCARCARLRA